MTRRELLTAVELAMAASALTATVYGLVRAAYDPYAAVTWVPIAIVGAATAGAIAGLAAVLFVGRAALLLAADAVQFRRDRDLPLPSASAAPWSRLADEELFDAYVAERAEHFATRRHGRPLPPTLPMPVEELAAAGRENTGGGR